MVTITDGVITRTLSCDQWALLNETPPSGFTVTANTCASSVTAFYSPFASVTLGDGTVVYVGLTMPASVFDVDGSPVTSSGTFEVTLIAQNANKVWAGPVSGADALPVFRALVANDIPNLSALNGLLNLTQIAQGGATTGQVLTWNGSNWVAQTPTAGITGSGAAGQIAYWNGSSSITGSNNFFYDVANNRIRVNTSSFLTNAALEVFKSYTNPTDANIALTGGIPLISWRNSTRRFALGSGYTGNNELTVLGTTTDNANPTSVLWKWFSDGQVEQLGSRLFINGGRINAGATANSFGANAAPSGVGFFVSLPGGERARFQAASGLSYVDFYTPASGSNRNYSFATSWANPGDFVLLRSTTAGADPATNTLYFNNGNTGVGGTSSPAQTLHVEGTTRITGSSGTPTAVVGRNANGDIANLTLSGLSITGGALTGIGGTIAATQVAYGSGSNTITGEADFLYTAATNRLQVGAGTPQAAFNAFFGSVTTEEAFRGSANASGSIIMLLQNAWGTGGTGNSIFQILTASGGGDPAIQFGVTGGSPGFAAGIDNSDADKFKITRDAAVPGESGNSSFVITNEATPKYGFNVDAPAYVIDMNERARFGQVMSRAATYAAPTAGTGAGTGPTFTITNATGNGFIINITTGTTPTLNGNIVTITIPWFSSGAVNATFSAYNDLAASHISRFKVGSTSNNNITLTNCNTALSASSTYALMVVFFG